MPDTTESLALLGGQPVRAKKKAWPQWPQHGKAEREALIDVLESGQWWYGKRVRQFEQEFAAFQGADHCVSCVSGTIAIEVCLQALGVGPGDEVIVPAYTFVGTATPVLRLGATPVFVDVDATWNMDPDALEQAVTPRTKAIIPVHFGGLIADMDRINAFAEAHGLKVIEDASHAWGSQLEGRGTGTLGDCGVFSFQASKNMTAGEGGAIVTQDKELAVQCRSIVNSGRVEGEEWYLHHTAGTNARLTEFAGAFLHCQLSRMPGHTALRAKNAARLDAALSAIEGLTPQPNNERMTQRAYHLYCLRIDPEQFGCTRERFIEAVEAEGLPISPGYPRPVNEQPAFDSVSGVACPVAEDLCRRSALWLRHTILLGSDADMDDIVAILTKVKRHAAELA